MVYADVVLTDTAVGDPCAGIAVSDSCDFVPDPLPANAVWVRWFDWQGPAESVGPRNAHWHATRIAGYPAKIAEGTDLGLGCRPAPGIRVQQMLATISSYGPSGQTVVTQACYSAPDLPAERTQLLAMLRSYRRDS